MKEVLGVDVGGVILDFIRERGTELDFQGERYLETPEIPGAIDAIARLSAGKFKREIYLISRDRNGPERVVAWLKSKNFFERVGIPEGNFNHCFERAGKAPICKAIGITHFVDDRAEILETLAPFVPNLYQFQSLDEDREAFAGKVPGLTFVESWVELEKLLTT